MIAALALAVLASARDHVVSREVEGEIVCTIHARNVPAGTIAQEIAAAASRKIEGLDGALAPIDVDLVDRPWSEALERVLGAAGARPRMGATIGIERDLLAGESSDEIAEAAFRSALRASPSHEESAAARLELGRLLEHRGQHRAARAAWEEIPSRHDGSPSVADAWREIAESALAEEEIDEAARALSALGALVDPHPHHAFARRALARILTRRGDALAALALLDTVDALYATRDPIERRERLIARAEALTANGDHRAALQALDRAASTDWKRSETLDALRARGEALAAAGDAGNASIAWLRAAQICDGKPRAAAFSRAAELALSAQDGLGALAIANTASREGDARDFAAPTFAAMRLLELVSSPSDDAADATLIAEEALSAGDLAAVRAFLATPADGALSNDLAARRVVLAAFVANQEYGLEPALDELRRALALFGTGSARERLFAAAATVLERRGLFARAANALGGEL